MLGAALLKVAYGFVALVALFSLLAFINPWAEIDGERQPSIYAEFAMVSLVGYGFVLLTILLERGLSFSCQLHPDRAALGTALQGVRRWKWQAFLFGGLVAAVGALMFYTDLREQMHANSSNPGVYRTLYGPLWAGIGGAVIAGVSLLPSLQPLLPHLRVLLDLRRRLALPTLVADRFHGVMMGLCVLGVSTLAFPWDEEREALPGVSPSDPDRWIDVTVRGWSDPEGVLVGATLLAALVALKVLGLRSPPAIRFCIAIVAAFVSLVFVEQEWGPLQTGQVIVLPAAIGLMMMSAVGLLLGVRPRER